MKTIIGFDYSMSKPAACVYHNDEYEFYSWPKDLNDKIKAILESGGVNIIPRKNIEIKDIVKYDIINSDILSDLIINSLDPFINKNTSIIFEGSSFASKGNVILSLTAWRYILIHKLSKLISLDNMITYAPITIKKTANCAKRGMGKKEMIDAFVATGIDIPLRNAIEKNPAKFQKKTGNWIDHLDDFVDAYFAVETFQNKLVDAI